MADTLVYNSCDANTDVKQGIKGPYWISPTTAVIVFTHSLLDLYFSRTVNGGVDWAETEIAAGTVQQVACWFDQETPGDSGTLVHIAWMDSDDGKTYYRTVDVSDGSLGTLRTVRTLTVSASPAYTRIGITKAVSGYLICAFLSRSYEIGCYRSIDAGANWTARADVFEADAAIDWLLLYPANTADPNDVCAIYWDVSSNWVAIKMYDDSENDWTETAIVNASEDTGHINMDGAIRHSDGAVLFAVHSARDTVGDDLLTWEVIPNDIDAPTATAKTNVFTDQDQSAQVAVLVNQQNDDVYIAYIKGGAWVGTVDVVFHKSADAMGSWGLEQAYSEAAPDDIRLLHSGRTVGAAGGWVQWSFYNDDLWDIFVNLVNDIEIPAGNGPEPPVRPPRPPAVSGVPSAHF